MNFSLTTFGCKVNQYESSGISQLMKQNGYTFVKDPLRRDYSLDEADNESKSSVHIINSCTVTENSDKKVKALISRLKRDNPSVKVILCGCFPKAFPDKAKSTGADVIIPGVFSPSSINLISLSKGKIWTEQKLPFSPQSERARAFLKIQDGCNRSCAYCIIPKARGPIKSRTTDDLMEEAEKLALSGHKEIVITGINLCAYNSQGNSLIDAVEAVCKINRIERVRLSSLEPDMITVSNVVRLSQLTKLCHHFHLSLQSGSDSVLERMNRRYTTDYYKGIVNTIREYFPGTAITTDIIVGFPGETDEEFTQTLTFAKEIGFAKIHTFKFSRREGTLAANMPEQIEKSIKQERMSKLCELAEQMRVEFFEGLVGSEQEVLIETIEIGKTCNAYGHTRCYTPVKIIGKYEGLEKNSMGKIRIVRAKGGYCIGEW